MTDSTNSHERLEGLARKALEFGGSDWYVSANLADFMEPADADFAAAASPQAILALIAENRAYREALLTARDYVADAIANADHPAISVGLSMRQMMSDDLARINAVLAQGAAHV